MSNDIGKARRLLFNVRHLEGIKMIKTVKYIFMIFLLSLVINCQDENNPIKSKITEDDLYIKNMFVGKWQFVSIWKA